MFCEQRFELVMDFPGLLAQDRRIAGRTRLRNDVRKRDGDTAVEMEIISACQIVAILPVSPEVATDPEKLHQLLYTWALQDMADRFRHDRLAELVPKPGVSLGKRLVRTFLAWVEEG